MSRGGRRPRRVRREDAAVWCPGGRLGEVHRALPPTADPRQAAQLSGSGLVSN
jgi:hypothetical protein